MNLGASIKHFRNKRLLKQKELAEMTGLSQSYLSQIEKSVKDPHLSTIKKIAKELDVPMPILFFMSLEEKDIKDNKKEGFKFIKPIIDSFLKEMI